MSSMSKMKRGSLRSMARTANSITVHGSTPATGRLALRSRETPGWAAPTNLVRTSNGQARHSQGPGGGFGRFLAGRDAPTGLARRSANPVTTHGQGIGGKVMGRPRTLAGFDSPTGLIRTSNASPMPSRAIGGLARATSCVVRSGTASGTYYDRTGRGTSVTVKPSSVRGRFDVFFTRTGKLIARGVPECAGMTATMIGSGPKRAPNPITKHGQGMGGKVPGRPRSLAGFDSPTGLIRTSNPVGQFMVSPVATQIRGASGQFMRSPAGTQFVRTSNGQQSACLVRVTRYQHGQPTQGIYRISSPRGGATREQTVFLRPNPAGRFRGRLAAFDQTGRMIDGNVTFCAAGSLRMRNQAGGDMAVGDLASPNVGSGGLSCYNAETGAVVLDGGAVLDPALVVSIEADENPSFVNVTTVGSVGDDAPLQTLIPICGQEPPGDVFDTPTDVPEEIPEDPTPGFCFVDGDGTVEPTTGLPIGSVVNLETGESVTALLMEDLGDRVYLRDTPENVNTQELYGFWMRRCPAEEVPPEEMPPSDFPGACYDTMTNEVVLEDGSRFVVQVRADLGDAVEFAYAEGVAIAPKCPVDEQPPAEQPPLDGCITRDGIYRANVPGGPYDGTNLSAMGLAFEVDDAAGLVRVAADLGLEAIILPLCPEEVPPPSEIPPLDGCITIDGFFRSSMQGHPLDGSDLTQYGEVLIDESTGMASAAVMIGNDTMVLELPLCPAELPPATIPPPTIPPPPSGCVTMQLGRLILVTDDPNSPANGMDMSAAIVDPNNGVAMLTIGSQTFTFPLCPVPPPPQTIPPPSIPPRGTPPGDCDPTCPPPSPPWCDVPSGKPQRPTQLAPEDGPCCSSCSVGLPCESGCDNHDHSH